MDYVLPGEVVLSRDPLMVAAAPGPEPTFDTSGLGWEVVVESVESVDLVFTNRSTMEAFDQPHHTGPSGWVTWDNLPSDTSIVTFADDETRRWIRVRSGVAVFPAEFTRGETFHLVALDAEGNELG